MAAPGTIANLVAPGDDAQNRKHEDLARQVKELAPSIMESILPLIEEIAAAAAAAQAAADAAALAAAAAGAAAADATAAVADLAARVSTTTSISSFNTGSLPNDATFHPYGASMPITIDVPTGKLVVTVGCGQATLNAGGVSVEGDATFSISGGVAAMMDYSASAFLTGSSVGVGASLVVQRAFTVTPGTYTITGQMYAWAAGTASASVNFQQPFLTVQVTG